MIKLLVTGFGAFPGVRSNPTLALLQALARRRQRFARLGIALDLYTLPVSHAWLAPQLAHLIGEVKPDAILHFGLAGRRREITIERFARNRANILHPDADGACAHGRMLQKNGPDRLNARVPLIQIISAWRRVGIAGTISRDAGDYLCNACFYQSLTVSDVEAAGFIHIPYPRAARTMGARRNKRPSLAQLITAAEIALIETARSLQHRRSATGRTSAQPPERPPRASQEPK
jgi:pyroglutamyl-peptidase